MASVNELALERGKRALKVLPGNVPATFTFVTISGAHLYGFPSEDSDIDLRGMHLAALRQVIGLKHYEETYESHGGEVDGIEVDCVSHEAKKYLTLLTKKNGYVLEQIMSPLVVHDGGQLEELRGLARAAMTKHLVHHYKGFFATQEKLCLKDPAPTAKAVLYLFRVLMTGLHALLSGEIEANILTLNENVFHVPFIADLVARKRAGGEFGKLNAGEFQMYYGEAKKLEAQLDPAFEASALPFEVQNLDALDEFLARIRQQPSRYR